MPYQIVLREKPLGYSRNSASKGQMVQVVAREFLSSDDGERFFVRMDGWPSEIVGALPPTAEVNPSNVNHLIALIRQDLTTTVYVNELEQVARIRSAGALAAGQQVRQSDIADIVEMRFEGVEIPEGV